MKKIHNFLNNFNYKKNLKYILIFVIANIFLLGYILPEVFDINPFIYFKF